MQKKIKNVVIIDKETGTIIREGSARGTEPEPMANFLGFTLQDGIKFIFYGGLVLVAVVKWDLRLKIVEEAMADQRVVNTKISDYMETSDAWHSTSTRHRFKGGAPVDGFVVTTSN